MLDCISHPLTFPKYSSVKHLEKQGNYALSKYYFYPFRWFYRHKVRMIEQALRGKRFKSITDFGSGPGLMTQEWSKYADKIYLIDEKHKELPKVDMTICASVMEFVPLNETFEKLAEFTKEIIVASPMKTAFSWSYFTLINDNHKRHSHQEITAEMTRYFSVNYNKEWAGLYFCARGMKR